MVSLVTSFTSTVTDKRRRSVLLDSSFSLADIDLYSISKISLNTGDDPVVLTVNKLFICSVNSRILIQLENEDEEEITIPIQGSSIILPFSGTVTLINPEDNPITLPATVSYVAV